MGDKREREKVPGREAQMQKTKRDIHTVKEIKRKKQKRGKGIKREYGRHTYK